MYLPPPTEGDFELAPAGTHIGVCYRIIDLGTQETTFEGQAKQQHKNSYQLGTAGREDERRSTIHHQPALYVVDVREGQASEASGELARQSIC